MPIDPRCSPTSQRIAALGTWINARSPVVGAAYGNSYHAAHYVCQIRVTNITTESH